MSDEIDAPRPGGRRRWRGVGLALLLIPSLSAAVVVGAWSMIRVGVQRSPEIGVPDLIGQDLPQASAQVLALGLRPEVAARRADPRQPAGRVLAQVPPPGGSTRPGRAVRLVVSLGGQRALIPDLVGSSEERAQLALRAAGFSGAARAEAPDAAPAGRVLGQQPPAGAEGVPGDEVALLLSAGPRSPAYVMPTLVGRSAAHVLAELRRRGFRRVQQRGSADAPARVVAQDPPPGRPVTTEDPIVVASEGG